ncbi:MAG: YHS domain-containing protein [Candidatus Omnitrophota bacterium]|nr:YHS domain-containing protein [Candidatus Omnitrophota bacterium]
MTKIICLVTLGLFVFMFTSSSVVFGMSCGSDKGGSEATCDHAAGSQMTECDQHAAAVPNAVVDAGNKVCPVLGESIDETTKAIYEYEGKIYNFCCAGCIEPFKKEPQKYIDKVNQELEANQSTK